MTISSKASRVVSCIFERISMILDILEHSIEHGRTCRNWRWLYTPPSFRVKLLMQLAYFFIIVLTFPFLYVSIYMWRKCIINTYVSESFVCSKFYIRADLTDLRKNFKQPISLFLAQSGLYREILNWLLGYRSWCDIW